MKNRPLKRTSEVSGAIKQPVAGQRLAAPFLLFLLQAVILLTRPSLLPMWGDELFTLTTAARPPAAILTAVGSDIHPPLYFLLAHYWLAVPFGWDPLVGLRVLSVLFALAATVVLDRVWLRRASDDVRFWTLALWISSPCLLLYARMARSYSLQTLLALVAAACAVRFASQPMRWRALFAYSASVAALLYTHYASGLGVWIASAVLLVSGARSWSRFAASQLLVAAAYAPWMWTLASALAKWSARSAPYRLSGSALAEPLLQAGFTLFSFLFGEAPPVWLLPVSVPLGAAAVWLAFVAFREHRGWALPAACAGVVAFAGVSRWVSYAFVPARLLFLLPALLAAVAAGSRLRPRFGAPAAALLLVTNLAGVFYYFQTRNLLNPAYVLPTDRIAFQIEQFSPPGSTVVWADALNFPSPVLRSYLDAGFPMRPIDSPEAARAALAELAAGKFDRVWLVRSTHDITPGRSLDTLEDALRSAAWNRRLPPYVPLSPTHRALLRLLAFTPARVAEPLPFAYEAWEFARPSR